MFSFQEDLTDLEISMFINEITESAVTGNIVSAFERTAEKIRYAALYALAMEAINDSDYEKAAERMEQLPDTEFDKKLLQINLYMSEGENDAAALLVEGRIMELGSKIQSYLYQLIELEEKTGNHQMAERVAETADQMVSLFDLWNYGKKVPENTGSIWKESEGFRELLNNRSLAGRETGGIYQKNGNAAIFLCFRS